MKTNFIKQLWYEINDAKNIKEDSKLFIQHKKLKRYIFNKKSCYIKDDDLPIETLLGSSYLIKGNNIIETYSWWGPEHSLYLQISVKCPMWLGEISIINAEPHDPENIEFLLSDCNIFHEPSNLQYSIIQFINAGFSLYNSFKS
jgi:hypothetical protein